MLGAELAVVRERYNGVRLHAGIGHVTPNDEHEGRGPSPSASSPSTAKAYSLV